MFNSNIYSIKNIPAALMTSVCSGINPTSNARADNTMFITLMLLLYNRVDNLKISYNKISSYFEDLNEISTDPGVYSIYWFEALNKNPDEILNAVTHKFQKTEKLPLQEKFLSERLKCNIEFRIMPNENTACIFTDSMINLKMWHAVQFIIPKLFPVFKNKQLTQEETNFLMTLTQKSQEDYVKAAIILSNAAPFKRFMLSRNLANFEKQMYVKKVELAKRNLGELERQMQNCMEEYKKACEKRTQAMAIVYGLETMADQHEDSAETESYLINNPHISNVNIDGSNISFVVKTELVPYAADEWDIVSKNEIYMSSISSNGFSREDTKLLLDSFLSENRCMKLKMCAYFKMDYFGSSVESKRYMNFSEIDSDLADYVPNPHLNIHNCFGENKSVILERLIEGDLISAIECSISCAQKVNIHEPPTFSPFVTSVLCCTGKCFVTEDGEEMTPTEALKYLKEKKNEQN